MLDNLLIVLHAAFVACCVYLLLVCVMGLLS
jgi:hypothetical protein